MESYIDVIQRAHISQLSGTEKKSYKFLTHENFITLKVKQDGLKMMQNEMQTLQTLNRQLVLKNYLGLTVCSDLSC